MESEIIRTVTDMDTGQSYVITRDSYKVYSQYEYRGWLITIRNYDFDVEELMAFATPTKYSHILNIDNYDDAWTYDEEEWEKRLGIKKIIDEDGYKYYETFQVCIEPGDYRDETYTSESIILHEIVKEITEILEPPKTDKYWYISGKYIKLAVLKQIQRKSITPKTGKRKPGFMNQAWAALVKERDKKCTNCGSVYDLHAHHIKPYKNHPELRLDVNNGTTLCGSCHRDWHKKNGK